MKSILTEFQKEVLENLSINQFIAENFYLSGGTALSEFYLHHRYSEDLDFFTTKEINFQDLASNLKPIFNKLDINVVDYQQEVSAKIFFLKKGKLEKLKTDFNFWAFEKIEKGIKLNLLEIDSLFDIAVNKIHTILTREKARDFIDFYFIFKNCKKFTFSDVLKGLKTKYDWAVDPLYLAARLMKVENLHDYPKMIKSFSRQKMISYFNNLAGEQRDKIVFRSG